MEPNIMMLHKCLNPSIGDAVVLRHGGTFAPSPRAARAAPPPTPPPPPPPHTHTHHPRCWC
jgi:hypothetical protein